METDTVTVGLGALLLPILIVAARQALEVFAKQIPDSATGIMGILRMVAKLFSGYTTNKE